VFLISSDLVAIDKFFYNKSYDYNVGDVIFAVEMIFGY
jgi:hypothetical protein